MKKKFTAILAAAAIAVAPAAFGQGSASAPPPDPADAVATLQKACLPILRGGAVKPVAQAAGFELRGGGWVMPIAGKGEIDLLPPDAANPHVCTLTINAPSADAALLRSALGAWASSQSPPLAPAAIDQSVPGASQAYVTSSWSARTPAGAESVVFTQPQPTGGQPAGATQQSTLLVSLSPA